jgi:DNA-binding transcriptional ArsR family regulator
MPHSHDLDPVFGALANSTRREVMEALRGGPKSVSELAEPHDMALPSFLQHLHVLEAAELVRTDKRGRTRVVEARMEPMLRLEAWLDAQRVAWEQRLDQLDDFLTRGE